MQKLVMANKNCHARLLTWVHIPIPPPELGFAPMSPWIPPGLRPFNTPGPAFCFIWARQFSHWAGFCRLNWVIFRGCFCEIKYNWVHTHSSCTDASGHYHYVIQKKGFPHWKMYNKYNTRRHVNFYLKTSCF